MAEDIRRRSILKFTQEYQKPRVSHLGAFGLAHIEQISPDYNETVSYLIGGHFRPKRFQRLQIEF